MDNLSSNAENKMENDEMYMINNLEVEMTNPPSSLRNSYVCFVLDFGFLDAITDAVIDMLWPFVSGVCQVVSLNVR